MQSARHVVAVQREVVHDALRPEAHRVPEGEALEGGGGPDARRLQREPTVAQRGLHERKPPTVHPL